MNEDITFFAKTNYRGQDSVFGVKTDDRRRHMYILGKTGMGKTTAMENMAASDIRNGKGVAIVDPHGEFAEKMLRVVPKNRTNDVVYFNPADLNHPIAFNILEKVEPEYKHLVSDGLVGVFKKIWADSWGPRLEYILRNAILALLDYPSSTLLGVTRMLVDKNYRKKVVDKIKDPVVKSFWVDEYANYSEKFRNEAISPIQNKVGQFLSTALIRNIIGQPQSTIDMRKLMDEGKIILMNLSKGKVGEEGSALLGAMMITKIQLAAMSRADVTEAERPDFYLYVDEFQNFATESFASILSEARKYRLNLIMGHQYITQMEEEVRDAVFGNVGTIICFRVGAQDAEFLEKEFEPVFYQIDLVNLSKYHMILKLMIDGVASNAFSAVGLPPLYEGVEGFEDTIIKVSRERYAKPRKIVEEKIIRWSGMSEEQLKVKESQREMAQDQSRRDRSQAWQNKFTPNAGQWPRFNRPYQQPGVRRDFNRASPPRDNRFNNQESLRPQVEQNQNRKDNPASQDNRYQARPALEQNRKNYQREPQSDYKRPDNKFASSNNFNHSSGTGKIAEKTKEKPSAASNKAPIAVKQIKKDNNDSGASIKEALKAGVVKFSSKSNG